MTIPASNIVTVNPAVIGSGGSPLSLNGLVLSTSELLPVGSVQSFSSAGAVSDYFGPSSDEYAQALIYFAGTDNSTIKPGAMLFAPYAETDRAAWLQSGSFEGWTLTELQGLSGTLLITVDGDAAESADINLATATSFSNACTIIAAAFTGENFTVTWNATNSRFYFTSDSAGDASTITFGTGTFATALKLTAATGAILSQGLDADTPTTAMDAVLAASTNWCLFTTMWEPEIADKTLFAEWVSAQNSRFGYVQWDTDEQAIANGSTTCFGYLAMQAEYDMVLSVYNTLDLATFALSAVACIDFSRTNARITTAFKHQSGFGVTVTDDQISENLLANGYSFYGSYGTGNDTFNFFYNGQISGQYLWLDTFVNQVYLNSQLQLALISLLTALTSIPYNQAGYALIRSAMLDPILAHVRFGGIRAGVTLSQSQRAQVNMQAGADVASAIETQGWYLQILDPGAQARGLRQTPVINFWYTDGGAVQQITLASIDII